MIYAYGLFWDVNEVDWYSGGNGRRMLGRIGQNAGKLRVINAYDQQGIYVLYGNYGPYYVGLAGKQPVGTRLRQHHLTDDHKGKWTRFSWFGFKEVQKETDENGFNNLSDIPQVVDVDSNAVIRLIEGTLIKAMGLSANIQDTKFPDAEEWHQIKRAEQQSLLERLSA